MSLLTDLQVAGLPVVTATDGVNASFSRSLTDEETELYLDILHPARIEYRADRADLKAQAVTAINRLSQIETADNPTNAQIIAAVKDLAIFEKKIIKVLARII